MSTYFDAEGRRLHALFNNQACRVACWLVALGRAGRSYPPPRIKWRARNVGGGGWRSRVGFQMEPSSRIGKDE